MEKQLSGPASIFGKINITSETKRNNILETIKKAERKVNVIHTELEDLYNFDLETKTSRMKVSNSNRNKGHFSKSSKGILLKPKIKKSSNGLFALKSIKEKLKQTYKNYNHSTTRKIKISKNELIDNSNLNSKSSNENIKILDYNNTKKVSFKQNPESLYSDNFTTENTRSKSKKVENSIREEDYDSSDVSVDESRDDLTVRTYKNTEENKSKSKNNIIKLSKNIYPNNKILNERDSNYFSTKEKENVNSYTNRSSEKTISPFITNLNLQSPLNTQESKINKILNTNASNTSLVENSNSTLNSPLININKYKHSNLQIPKLTLNNLKNKENKEKNSNLINNKEPFFGKYSSISSNDYFPKTTRNPIISKNNFTSPNNFNNFNNLNSQGQQNTQTDINTLPCNTIGYFKNKKITDFAKNKLHRQSLDEIISEFSKTQQEFQTSVENMKKPSKLYIDLIASKYTADLFNDKLVLGGFSDLKEKLMKGYFTYKSDESDNSEMTYKTFDQNNVIHKYNKINTISESSSYHCKDYYKLQFGMKWINQEEIRRQTRKVEAQKKRDTILCMLENLNRKKKVLSTKSNNYQ